MADMKQFIVTTRYQGTEKRSHTKRTYKVSATGHVDAAEKVKQEYGLVDTSIHVVAADQYRLKIRGWK